MNRNIHARDAQLRAISIFSQRPESARAINRGSAEVRDGLSCIYEQDGHKVSVDMPSAIGGSEEGPAPGYFGRAAICSCLAIGIKMTAAREGFNIDTVRVGIEQDWDNRGVLGMEGVNAAPNDTRITIEIRSPEPEEKVRELVRRALSHDPWFLAFRDAQPISTAISVLEGAK
ncbi:OsmC family protein [Celeribacter litoreus]|uniref:OsmC family protein n=1 Tax=Celeribacter litoreus TaxID=2876714 RepID=UPI001CCC5B32|nr:OsmC family protein [Celeribacter litoreus]MCA0042543.1 OsmC family protein [Celeribacter litoreus]